MTAKFVRREKMLANATKWKRDDSKSSGEGNGSDF